MTKDTTEEEAVAIALAKNAGADVFTDEYVREVLMQPSHHVHARWTSAARVAITAYKTHLSSLGLVIVPREPTEAMVKAGGSALQAYIDSLPPEELAKLKPRKKRAGDNAGYCLSPWRKCRLRWQAMIDAAPKEAL